MIPLFTLNIYIIILFLGMTCIPCIAKYVFYKPITWYDLLTFTSIKFNIMKSS